MHSFTVTAAEFVRQFGFLRQTKGDHPVFITHHGKTTHVLVNAKQYEDLNARAERSSNSDMNGDPLPPWDEFADWLPVGTLSVDNHLNVLVANEVAHMMLSLPRNKLIGHRLYDVAPALEETLLAVYLARALRCHEPQTADIPGLFGECCWTRVSIYPLPTATTILFYDITEDVERHRLADTKLAITEAMKAHGEIGYVRVNARGHIEHVNQPTCAWLDLPEERLMGIAFSDLVMTPDRPTFRQQLNAVLRNDLSIRIDIRLLSNSGTTRSTHMSVSSLNGAYGNEGAVLIFTEEATAKDPAYSPPSKTGA